MHHRPSVPVPLKSGPAKSSIETQVILRINIAVWGAPGKPRPNAGQEEIPACQACCGDGCPTCLGTGLTSADVDFAGLLRDRGLPRRVA